MVVLSLVIVQGKLENVLFWKVILTETIDALSIRISTL